MCTEELSTVCVWNTKELSTVRNVHSVYMLSQACTCCRQTRVLRIWWTLAKAISWWPVRNITPMALMNSLILGDTSGSIVPMRTFNNNLPTAAEERQVQNFDDSFRIRSIQYKSIVKYRKALCSRKTYHKSEKEEEDGKKEKCFSRTDTTEDPPFML